MRHLFRKMAQNEEETIDQFGYRLRPKARYCDYANIDDVIRDQLIEKCSNDSIRRKFLERADSANLLVTARSIEAVEM